MDLSPTVLSEAMEAYVQTFPVRDRLKEHIRQRSLLDHAEKIEAALDACLWTAEDYLYKYPGGVPWTDVFKREYESILVRHHPWLDRPSLDRIMAFSGWLCWHEGLNAK